MPDMPQSDEQTQRNQTVETVVEDYIARLNPKENIERAGEFLHVAFLNEILRELDTIRLAVQKKDS